MTANLPAQENEAGVKNQGKIQDHIGEDSGSLHENLSGMRIPTCGQIEHFHPAVDSRASCFPLSSGSPAFQNASATQDLFEPAKFMNGGRTCRYVGNAQVADLSG